MGLPIIQRKVSTPGWIVFAALLLVCLPLCWIPFLIDDLKENEYRCAQCGIRMS